MRAVIIFIIISQLAFNSFSQKKEKTDKKKAKTEQDGALVASDEIQNKFESTLIEAEKQLLLDNPAKAIELFNTALELSPDNGAVNFKMAEVLSKMGKISDAMLFAQKALNSDRTNMYYFLQVAELHKSLGDFAKSADVYAEMIEKLPNAEAYLFDLAILYQFLGKDANALATYKRAEDIYGINEMVLREKQKIYIKNKDYNGLIADWDQLIAENPGNNRYTIELAEFLISSGKIEEAKTRLNNLQTDDIHVYLLKSRIALKEGNTAEAMKITLDAFESNSADYKTKIQLMNGYMDFAITPEQFESIVKMALSLGTTYPDQYEPQAYAADVLYRMEKKELAKDYYLKAIKIDPNHFDVWQNILNIEAELNQYDSVAIHAEQALEYFPNQAIIYYFAGTGHMINRDYKKAVEMLKIGTKYAAEPQLLTIFYGQLGDAYNSLKEKNKSYESYELALKSNPNNDHVLNNYSYFLSLDKKNLEKALEMSTKLVAAHPDNATYLDTHGWVLYVKGQYSEAEKYLKLAAKTDEDGTVIEHYGDVLFKLGRVDEAVAQWQKASKMKDASENIQKKIADKTLYE
jgi:tetratricopeptide (TPR) repeat protein